MEWDWSQRTSKSVFSFLESRVFISIIWNGLGVRGLGWRVCFGVDLTSKLSEYAYRTSPSDLDVFVNFDMLITKIISIFPNLACVSSTSALKFEISIDTYDLILASICGNGNFKLWSWRTRDTGQIGKNAYDIRNQHIKIDKNGQVRWWSARGIFWPFTC